jgi:hypothetical protein
MSCSAFVLVISISCIIVGLFLLHAGSEGLFEQGTGE